MTARQGVLSPCLMEVWLNDLLSHAYETAFTHNLVQGVNQVL